MSLNYLGIWAQINHDRCDIYYKGASLIHVWIVYLLDIARYLEHNGDKEMEDASV